MVLTGHVPLHIIKRIMNPGEARVTTSVISPSVNRATVIWTTLLVAVGLALFTIGFAMVSDAYYQFANARFPNVGDSPWLATIWGVVSRLYVIIPCAALVFWRPRLFGFQIGRTRQHWRLLVFLLLVNCGVVAAYILLTGSGTPYSGNQWLLTEIVIVPVVEETMWRGIIYAVLLMVLRRVHPAHSAGLWAVWMSGLAFGLAHGVNVLAGVPLAFVWPQVLNAAIWGVAYGYARMKTDSVYPPMILHSAMNLVVVLF
jgi:membrane protease YdiL (CAAX protease family)